MLPQSTESRLGLAAVPWRTLHTSNVVAKTVSAQVVRFGAFTTSQASAMASGGMCVGDGYACAPFGRSNVAYLVYKTSGGLRLAS